MPSTEAASRQIVNVRVNGTTRTDLVEPRTLLVHYLRDQLGLTGTHVGCDTSQCGACTVLLDGEAVKSCSIFAVQAEGHDITTVEGLAEGGKLHPVQEGFHQEHALQCGYCTPGFVMSTVSLLTLIPRPSDDEVSAGLEGNICRCTGYVNIKRAVKWASDAMALPAASSTEG
jgi:aerobic carbon-monoxide dehydrogenase small subunit